MPARTADSFSRTDSCPTLSSPSLALLAACPQGSSASPSRAPSFLSTDPYATARRPTYDITLRPLPQAVKTATFTPPVVELEAVPPARPRPPKPVLKDSRMRRMSIALKQVLTPRPASVAPSFLSTTVGPSSRAPSSSNTAPALAPRSRTPSPSPGTPIRPPSPPYTPRLNARVLAQNLMGPPVRSPRLRPNATPSRTNPPSSATLHPPPQHSKPRSLSHLPTAVEQEAQTVRVREQRRMREDAEVLERKRRSAWFTQQAGLGREGGMEVPSPADQWSGLRREDLEDVLALPSDPRRSPISTEIDPAQHSPPVNRRSTVASLYSGSSLLTAEDDEAHHPAMPVSPPLSPPTNTLSSHLSATIPPLDLALSTTNPTVSTPSFQFRNPFPLQPSPSPTPRPPKAPKSPFNRLTSFLSPSDSTHILVPDLPIRRTGVHAEVFTRETLGRRLRETDFHGDEDSRRTTESVYLE